MNVVWRIQNRSNEENRVLFQYKRKAGIQIFQNKLDGIPYWGEGLSSDTGLRIGMSHAKDKKLWISKLLNDIV